MNPFNTRQLLVDKEKVIKYLLNTSHPDGRSKARMFLNYGFDVSDWKVFASALRKHASEHPVISEQKTPFGTKFVIEGSLETPIAKKLLIRSVWMIRIKEQQPVLITAYPI